jgi:hypothetical protein
VITRPLPLALLLSAVLVAAAPARADELFGRNQSDRPAASDGGPSVGWGMGAGALTALVPLSIGASIFASDANVDHTVRNPGVLVAGWGLALAPIVSHLVVREWKRAAIFGSASVACAIGLTVLLEVQPNATTYGTRETRFAFGLLTSLTTISAAVGLIDTLGARDRWVERERTRRRAARPVVVPAPFVAQGGGGLAVGGLF